MLFTIFSFYADHDHGKCLDMGNTDYFYNVLFFLLKLRKTILWQSSCFQIPDIMIIVALISQELSAHSRNSGLDFNNFLSLDHFDRVCRGVYCVRWKLKRKSFERWIWVGRLCALIKIYRMQPNTKRLKRVLDIPWTWSSARESNYLWWKQKKLGALTKGYSPRFCGKTSTIMIHCKGSCQKTDISRSGWL